MKRFFSKKFVNSPKESLDSESAFIKGEISKLEGTEVTVDLSKHVVLLHSENFQDPISAFTQRINENFIAVEKHLKLPLELSHNASDDSVSSAKESPFLLTDQALYLLHPDYDKVSFKKALPNSDPQTNDVLQWYKGYYSKKWSNNSGVVGVKGQTQTVLNDLFTAMYILPKWRMSLFYVESVEIKGGFWYLHYFSGEEKDKGNVKDNVGRVSRRFRVKDEDKLTPWVETLKFVFRAYWMKKWEEIGILDSQEKDIVESPNDIYQYHAWMHKINRKGQEKYRCIVFTTHHMYLVNTGPGEQLSSTPTIRWKVGIACLKEIRFYPEEPAVLGLLFDKGLTKKFSKKVHTSYDLRCADEDARNAHAMEIGRLFFITTKGKSLPIVEKKGKPVGSKE